MESTPKPLPPPAEQTNQILTQGRRDEQYRCGGCLHTVLEQATGYCTRCQDGKTVTKLCRNCGEIIPEKGRHRCSTPEELPSQRGRSRQQRK